MVGVDNPTAQNMSNKCLNPGCSRVYTPGHYGRKQKVCSYAACRAWYRGHWRATRRPPRGLAKGDYTKVVRAAKRDIRFWALVVCARESGLRKGELLGLTWVDMINGAGKVKAVVEVRGQWKDSGGFVLTKNRQSKLGLFSAVARKALAAYRKALTAGNGRIKPDSRVWPLSEAWVWGRWVDLQIALGVKNKETGAPYRFHDLRHTVGCELVRAGRVDLAKQMLGHKRIETTMIYAEQSPEDILADVERVRRGRG